MPPGRGHNPQCLPRDPSPRLALTCFLLLAFLALQVSSLAEFHEHSHSGPSPHCCVGCHLGQLPALGTAAVSFDAPQDLEWSAPAPRDPSFRSRVSFALPSRAPPA